MTRALQSHHVWQFRRLGLKGESMDVRDACDSAGTSPVEGHSCCPSRSDFNVSRFACVCSGVGFIFVGMCSYDKILCGFWRVRG